MAVRSSSRLFTSTFSAYRSAFQSINELMGSYSEMSNACSTLFLTGREGGVRDSPAHSSRRTQLEPVKISDSVSHMMSEWVRKYCTYEDCASTLQDDPAATVSVATVSSLACPRLLATDSERR